MAEPREHDPLRPSLPVAVAVAKEVVERIDEVDLDQPTPCESWTVAEVLNAIAVKANLFAEAVDDPRPVKPSPWPDLIGTNPRTAVSDALDALVAAYDQPADALLVLPLGTVPWPVARQVATLDVTLHSWDLAVATGQQLDLPADLVDDCLAAAAVITDDLRDRGEFKPELNEGVDSTPLEQLLSRAGRQPGWTRSSR